MAEKEEKRAKGSGSVYRRKKNGRSCASVIFPDGKRKVVYPNKEDLTCCKIRHRSEAEGISQGIGAAQ
jgi:hypothetical protein